jgi:hypothetical protein
MSGATPSGERFRDVDHVAGRAEAWMRRPEVLSRG